LSAPEEIALTEANAADAGELAAMNAALIRDEGHRNRMSLAELTERMARFLSVEGYAARKLVLAGRTIGYCLYRDAGDHVYIRQLYVVPELRSRGLGRRAFALLRERAWGPQRYLRVEVLARNRRGWDFWRSVGFGDYAMTLELNGPA
jgi:ribosomal protein S18 acetylase RimI-like enzyme